MPEPWTCTDHRPACPTVVDHLLAEAISTDPARTEYEGSPVTSVITAPGAPGMEVLAFEDGSYALAFCTDGMAGMADATPEELRRFASFLRKAAALIERP